MNKSKKIITRVLVVLVFCVVLFSAIGLTAYAADDAQGDAGAGAEADAGAGAEGENPENPENPETGLAPDDINVTDMDNSVLEELTGVDGSKPLEVLLMITIVSVAPSILLMMTSFTRIIIVFGFLRNAMSTQSTPPNQVLTGLALFLTIFIMWPVFAEINDVAYKPYAEKEITAWEAIEAAGGPLKTFMLRQTTNDNMEFFMDLSDATIYDIDEEGNKVPIHGYKDREINLENYQDQLSLREVVPSFMISELSRAFQMGFLLFIPFLVIDMVVASTLMSMGMMMLPPAMISLPFKIMLFVLINGWQMLVGSLVTSFNTGL